MYASKSTPRDLRNAFWPNLDSIYASEARTSDTSPTWEWRERRQKAPLKCHQCNQSELFFLLQMAAPYVGCHFEKPFQPIRVFLLTANGGPLRRPSFSRQNCVQRGRWHKFHHDTSEVLPWTGPWPDIGEERTIRFLTALTTVIQVAVTPMLTQISSIGTAIDTSNHFKYLLISIPYMKIPDSSKPQWCCMYITWLQWHSTCLFVVVTLCTAALELSRLRKTNCCIRVGIQNKVLCISEIFYCASETKYCISEIFD